ncbi:hypothetical protein KIPB_002788, partial [Kipferlia bialata]
CAGAVFHRVSDQMRSTEGPMDDDLTQDSSLILWHFLGQSARDVCVSLLSRGADSFIPDNAGLTPRDYVVLFLKGQRLLSGPDFENQPIPTADNEYSTGQEQSVNTEAVLVRLYPLLLQQKGAKKTFKAAVTQASKYLPHHVSTQIFMLIYIYVL